MSNKKREGNGNSFTRRSFIKSTVAAAVISGINPSVLFAGEESGKISKSLVAVVEDKKSITDTFKIDAPRARAMIDEAIKRITGTKSISEAWAKIFPNLKDNEVIGMKPNCVNWRIPSHPEVLYSIADSMADAGIKKENILIWDNVEGFLEKAGYKINKGKEGYKCYGTFIGKDAENIGLDPEAKVQIKSQNFERTHSKILSQHIDYFINVPVLKSADSPGISGVTLSLKNMYGTISIAEQATVGLYPEDMPEAFDKMHRNHCNPQIAEVNLSEHIMKKTKLVIIDALAGVYNGAPSSPPQGVSHRIVMSTDRVAADVTGVGIINEKRKEMKVPEVSKETAGHIWSAEKMGIGTTNAEIV